MLLHARLRHLCYILARGKEKLYTLFTLVTGPGAGAFAITREQKKAA